MLIGLLILYNAWSIVRETVEILLEATPRDLDMVSMIEDMKQVDGVLGVHDLHVWSLTQNLRTMSAHILTEDVQISQGALIQSRINELISNRYHIAHATLQLESVDCEPDALYCDMNGVIHVYAEGQGE
jgi:cobalt-zinc-cadmium efflux system protein